MANDLEQRMDLERRRQAVAAALRAIMAEPLPVRFATPARPVNAPTQPAFEPPPVSSAPAEGAAERAVHAAEDRKVTEEWDDVEFADRGDATVPPLEPVGSMSLRASLALFGHA